MSTELAAEQLTDAHRVAQANIALDAVGKLTAVSKVLLKPANLDSYADYMRAMTAVIEAGRDTSAHMAATYYDTIRDLFGVEGGYDSIAWDVAPIEQIQTSLLVTGPIRVKQALAKGDSMEIAMEKALLASAGATTRLIADAGRDTVRENVHRDSRSVGYLRVTDGHPCSFCEMLAGRGAVYKSEYTAGRGAHDPYHDHCLCTVQPVFFKHPSREKRPRHGR